MKDRYFTKEAVEKACMDVAMRAYEQSFCGHLPFVKAMTEEEYKEWAKTHVRENPDGTHTIYGD